eukprot:66506-Amphidinium_carterae.1
MRGKEAANPIGRMWIMPKPSKDQRPKLPRGPPLTNKMNMWPQRLPLHGPARQLRRENILASPMNGLHSKYLEERPVESTGPQDRHTMRFLGPNLGHFGQGSGLPEGSITINRIEYVSKLEPHFSSIAKTSVGQGGHERPKSCPPRPRGEGIQFYLAGVAGSINWLALRSWPDITWVVAQAARFVSKIQPLVYHRLRLAQYLP